MSRALWLPAALQDHGLTVHETPGWETRGDDTLNPRGVVCHHTASAAGSNTPALGTVINGRPDLPGPLCHVLLARNGDCHIVASGAANHAGAGGWHGLTGNSSVLGIEAENNGVGEPWPDHQLDAYVRLCAAMCDGGGFTPDTVCFHREWAPTRKIDPAGPGIPGGDEWRARVAAALNGDHVTPEQMAQLGQWMQEQRSLAVKEITAAIVGEKGKPGRIVRKLNRLLEHAGAKPTEGD